MRQPPEKLATGCCICSSVKPEAEQQLLGARPHGVGVGIGQRGCSSRDQRAVLVAFRLGFGAASSASSRRSVVSPSIAYSSAARSSGGRLLRHVGHAPFGREVDFALVGVQFAAQQREQARLAGAVGADQADLVAGIERDVDRFEQRLDAAHEGDL